MPLDETNERYVMDLLREREELLGYVDFLNGRYAQIVMNTKDCIRNEPVRAELFIASLEQVTLVHRANIAKAEKLIAKLNRLLA